MSNVIDLHKGKKKETVKNPPPADPFVRDTDFGDRVARIKASLDRINILMAQLRNMQHKHNKK